MKKDYDWLVGALLSLKDEDWRDYANCKDADTNLFLDEDPTALSLCAGCPVQLECLESALQWEDEVGVRGGFIAEERSAMIGFRKRTRPYFKYDLEEAGIVEG